MSYEESGRKLGQLVDSKQKQYGDSAGRTGAIMKSLYSEGIPVHAYDDALLVVRVIDKLCRIAQRGADGKDLGGESPWRDVAGYGLLGEAKDGGGAEAKPGYWAVGGDGWKSAVREIRKDRQGRGQCRLCKQHILPGYLWCDRCRGTEEYRRDLDLLRESDED